MYICGGRVCLSVTWKESKSKWVSWLETPSKWKLALCYSVLRGSGFDRTFWCMAHPLDWNNQSYQYLMEPNKKMRSKIHYFEEICNVLTFFKTFLCETVVIKKMTPQIRVKFYLKRSKLTKLLNHGSVSVSFFFSSRLTMVCTLWLSQLPRVTGRHQQIYIELVCTQKQAPSQDKADHHYTHRAMHAAHTRTVTF